MTTATLTLETAKIYVRDMHAKAGDHDVDIIGCGFIDPACVRLNVTTDGGEGFCIWDVWVERDGQLYGEC